MARCCAVCEKPSYFLNLVAQRWETCDSGKLKDCFWKETNKSKGLKRKERRIYKKQEETIQRNKYEPERMVRKSWEAEGSVGKKEM